MKKKHIGKIDAKVEKGVVLEVTQEDYEAGLRRGWDEDDMLPPGKYVSRPLPPELRPKPEDLLPENINVICELRLKLDIFNCLKRLAGSDEMKDVERVLNEKLREALAEELRDGPAADIRSAA